jgi:hypothetical protein
MAGSAGRQPAPKAHGAKTHPTHNKNPLLIVEFHHILRTGAPFLNRSKDYTSWRRGQASNEPQNKSLEVKTAKAPTF